MKETSLEVVFSVDLPIGCWCSPLEKKIIKRRVVVASSAAVSPVGSRFVGHTVLDNVAIHVVGDVKYGQPPPPHPHLLLLLLLPIY